MIPKITRIISNVYSFRNKNVIKSRRSIDHIRFNPFTPSVAIWVQLKHTVPRQVKPSFVTFDIRAL